MRQIQHIAAIIYSYKRFMEVQGQIYSMLHQDTPLKAIYVAVKGFPRYYVERFISDRFKEFPAVTIKTVSNKHQLSNLIDCVRGEDWSDIDYFLKIDDDDCYPVDYVSSVKSIFNKQLRQNQELQGHGIQQAYVHAANRSHKFLQEDGYESCFGGTLGFTPAVLEKLIEIEIDPSILHSLFGKRSMAEDELIRELAMKLGGFHHHGQRMPFIYNHATPSCMRNDGEYLGLSKNVYLSPTSFQRAEEEYILLKHPVWTRTYRLLGDSLEPVNSSGPAVPFRREEGRIDLLWEEYGREQFVWQPEGYYLFDGQQA